MRLFEVLDTWFSAGLAGSGSHDYRTADLFVPETRSFVLGDPPLRSEALYRYSWPLGIC
jgi:indole-3-acetate monooxygenase